MLNLGRIRSSNCQGLTRRAMLELGACSALGLGLPHWFANRATAETPLHLREGESAQLSNRSPSATSPQIKSVLLLWLWGGPSHHEMWDPKPNAPVGIRGSYAPISTTMPGMQISELLPMSAAVAHKFAIVRSMAHDQSDHNVGGTIALTGNVSGARASGAIPFPGPVRPSFGSLVSYLTRERTGEWPAFTCIGPSCKVSGADLRGQTANALGAAHEPFRLDGFDFERGVQFPRSLESLGEIGDVRLTSRRELLARVDAWQRRIEQSGDAERYDELRQKAFGLLTSGGAKQALNLDAERDSLRDRYGRTVFGQNLILARRLLEVGVPFLQVNWSGDAEDEQQGGDGGWDLHYRLFERMQDRYCPIFDRAFTALLDDLDQRGMLDSTLVLAMGEFGRSPKISGIGGREHWPFGYSIAVAGGGTPAGAVIGATTADGGHPATRPNHPVDVITTVLEKMRLDRISLLVKEAGILGSVIPELV